MERLTERRRREALALACLIITAGHAQAAGGQQARAVSSGSAAVADPMNLGFEPLLNRRVISPSMVASFWIHWSSARWASLLHHMCRCWHPRPA